MTYDLNTPSVAKLWTYHPDWSGGYEVTRSFRTDIITSRNRNEQRRALRDVPRFSARYGTVAQDAALRSANHFLRTWQNKPVAVPDFSRYSLLTASSSVLDTALTLASPPPWVAANRLLVLCSDTASELVEVASIVGSTINLEDPLTNAWPSGSVIRPAIHGLLDGQTSSSRFHRGAADIGVSINAYPGGEPVEAEGSPDITFNGYEVFTAEPNWQGAPNLEYLWPVEQVDYGIGRTAQFRPIDRSQRLAEAEFAGLGPSAAQDIEQAFLRAKGRRGAFYRGTGEQDFVLYANASGATFLAEGNDLSDAYGGTDFDANPEAIEICLTNGTRLHRIVTDISASGGNSQITVNSSVTITLAGTARISWMPLVRFASDDMTTSWRTPISATIRATFQSVKA